MSLTEKEKQEYQTMLVQTTKAMEAMDAVSRMYVKLETQGTLTKILDDAERNGRLTLKDEEGQRYPSLEMMSVLKAMKFAKEFEQ